MSTDDYLYLTWRPPNGKIYYIVGTLSKKEHFEFAYGHAVDDAIKNGFTPLISFPDLNKVYKSKDMFPAFACRLPDKNRRDIENILQKYGMTEYDEYEFLKRSGARLPIDTLWFIEPQPVRFEGFKNEN
ncbi:MAG: hypothetical protein GXZ14_00950 [Ruminococcaceae bacterium]|nr:hypothetical protein [Oscillospiraceae bacterium]